MDDEKKKKKDDNLTIMYCPNQTCAAICILYISEIKFQIITVVHLV